MKMAQTKVPNNKLGTQANTIRTDDTDSYYLQNMCVKGKGADLKTRKMKKSRSIKRSSPEKASPSKSPCTSPNYMKSTRSSEAKKLQTEVSISGLSKLQRVAKTLRRISSLKRVRTLTRRNICVQSATCSSAQKELKFPTKLMLHPGATESEGSSAVKVCSYNHCSLNRHECTPAPPLKSFLSSKRRLLKTQKVMPFTPVRDQTSGECVYKEQKISTTWSDKKGIVLAQSKNLEDYLEVLLGDKLRPCHQEEITDSEWQQFSDVDSVSDCKSNFPEQPEEPDVPKEEDNATSGLENRIAKIDSFHTDDATVCYTNSEIKSIDEQGGFFSDPVRKLPEDRDEFEEKEAGNDAEQEANLDLSNDDFVSDWRPTETGSILSHKIDGTRDCSLGYIASKAGEEQLNEPNMVKQENETSKEENEPTIIIEESELIANTVKGMSQKINDMELCSTEITKAVNNIEAEPEQREEGNGVKQKEIESNKFIVVISKTFKEKNDTSTVKFNPDKNSFVKVQEPEMDGTSSTVELDVFPVIRNQTRRAKPSCNKFKRSTRCKKADEKSKKARGFNPRGPKFLPVEPDSEAERVVLRHQEMDERRNPEEWMTDYALRKVVNRLAPARMRKVALLVEAFETVCQNQNLIPL